MGANNTMERMKINNLLCVAISLALCFVKFLYKCLFFDSSLIVKNKSETKQSD